MECRNVRHHQNYRFSFLGKFKLLLNNTGIESLQACAGLVGRVVHSKGRGHLRILLPLMAGVVMLACWHNGSGLMAGVV